MGWGGVIGGWGVWGAIVGGAPMAYAFSHYGWRNSMFWIAFVFFAITILLIFLVKDKKSNPVASITATPRTNNLMRDIKSILSTKDMWLNCLFIGCLYAPTSTFGEQWGALFSSLDMHTSITAGAWSVGFIFMGLAIGCPLIGILSDRLRNRIKVMRGCAIICFITIIIIIYHNLLGIHLSQNSLHLIMFIYGFFNSGIVPSYALSSEIIHRQVAGVALGVTNMASVIIGSLFIPIVGLLIDSVGNKASSSLSNTAFTVNSFYIAFALLPVCFIICILSSYFIKETHCKAIQE
ncbi:MAG: MFS transporter [Burkholderiales bacterium]